MIFLKSGVLHTVVLGPFVSSTDGKTPVTTLASSSPLGIAYTNVYLSKNGGAFAAKLNTTQPAHLRDGYYSCVIGTTDVNENGALVIEVNATGCLPVRHDYVVMASDAYDSFISNTGVGVRADVRGWLGSAPATPDTAGYPKITVKSGTGTGELNLAAGRTSADVVYWNGSAVAGVDTAGYPKVTIKDGTGTGELDTTSGKVSIATGGIAAASFAAGAIDAAALAADAANEVRDAILAAVVESEGSYTVKQVLSVALAAVAGVTASNGTVLKSPNGVATRISATVNGSNERTAMTITPSA